MPLESPERDGSPGERAGSASPVYRFGAFVLVPGDQRLSRNGDEIPLRPKSFDVLVQLVRHHGHLVTREELLAAVWPETHVTEQVLSHSIWEVRKALDSDGDSSRYIRTVPRRGYEFAAEVTESVAPHAATTGAAGPGRAARYVTASVIVVGCAAGAAWWVVGQGSRSRSLQAVPLATDPGFENWPTFSPDGNHVAFQRTVEGVDAIFVKQVGEEGALRRTFAGLDHAASWSPDGRWIAFLRAHAPAAPLRLMVVPPVAGAEREVAQINAPVYWNFRPAWTPDSQALIVPDREGAPLVYSLYRISIDGGGRTRLTVPDGRSIGEGDKDPAVSPDGTRLAFSRNGDLHLVELDGQHQASGPPRALARTAGLGGLWGLAWTADSREIVFAAGDWPAARLFRVAAAGGPIRPLAWLGEGAFAPAISTTGSRLAYMEWITSADIWQVGLGDDRKASAEPTRLISSSRLDSDPAFSPDGRRIAFRSNRTGPHGIWIASSSGGSARLLEPVGQPEGLAAPDLGFSWSPDQASMAFAARGDLYVVDIGSGQCRPLTTGATLDESPIWSPDGRWVYFSSFQDGTWQVSRVRADGGQPEPLTRDGGRVRAVSPDGLRLYYTRDEKLWTLPGAGGDPVEVLGLAPDDVAVTERGFFFVVNSPAYRIQYFDLESRSSTVVAEPDEVIMGLSVSPDRSRLVYGLIDHKRADLMLVEGFE